ncbi:hypothetical protein PGT21_006747 [Puccinia graminis f. sp. tritici]|uniref:Uncharacterized protein n=1 Tax=Puccinia graminis f. sp. tritici TaxID=56615 RepID=A0A5B0NJZ0_PUCGR|nr:hypothetical protein PGT21_006747 [Puccinia graminis f. sp. tritici]
MQVRSDLVSSSPAPLPLGVESYPSVTFGLLLALDKCLLLSLVIVKIRTVLDPSQQELSSTNLRFLFFLLSSRFNYVSSG